ncbi:MFS transporter [Candidatus Bandiella numerosa]|uniref:MFS transporter n=1 Tax=Candidatus Bandiella numerosa TaxID=2570586 RepID=UPI003977B4F1
MSANNSKLTRYQKEAIAVISFGTFLEYFDLMLYVHMAILLDDLFFPKSDPTTARLLAAFAFSSTYFLRPIGGLVIGKIGYLMGRKATIILTTFLGIAKQI